MSTVVEVACPACRGTHYVPADADGRTAWCPRSGRVYTISVTENSR